MSDAPPLAPREPHDVSVHGDPRIDDYFWLRDRDDPRTLAYLKAENAYADAWFAPHAALKETLYQEMLSRIQQDDDSVPMRKGDWWYSTADAHGRAVPAPPAPPRRRRRAPLRPERRRRDPARPQRDGARQAVPAPRPDRPSRRDASRLAYTLDLTGGRDFTLHVKDLASGSDRRLVGRAGRRRRPGPTTAARSTT